MSRAGVVRGRLLSVLQAEEGSLLVREEGGGCQGGTLTVRVASPLFVGRSRVERHRMVSAQAADQQFHALVIEANLPKEKQ